jgi:hypothetical protein
MVFAAEILCVMLLFRIATLRRWLLRPGPIVIIALLEAIAGYAVFPGPGAP